MLVLTAKRDDRIKIGDNIEILIIYTADSRVRIGIEAPKDLRIERKPKQKEAGAAAGATTDSATDSASASFDALPTSASTAKPPAEPAPESAGSHTGVNGHVSAGRANRPDSTER